MAKKKAEEVKEEVVEEVKETTEKVEEVKEEVVEEVKETTEKVEEVKEEVVEEVKETTEKVEEVKKESKKTLVANTSFNDKYTGEKYAEKTEFIVVKEDIETTKVKDNQYKISAKRAEELQEKGYID